VATLAMVWGSAFLWIRLGLTGFSPLALTGARLAIEQCLKPVDERGGAVPSRSS